MYDEVKKFSRNMKEVLTLDVPRRSEWISFLHICKTATMNF
jgi:hypothetical protein